MSKQGLVLTYLPIALLELIVDTSGSQPSFCADKDIRYSEI